MNLQTLKRSSEHFGKSYVKSTVKYYMLTKMQNFKFTFHKNNLHGYENHTTRINVLYILFANFLMV